MRRRKGAGRLRRISLHAGSRPNGPAAGRLGRRRPRSVRDAGLGDRRGADPRLHEPRGARPHARQRRDALLEPLAPGAVAQGRDLREHDAAALAALRLRRRRAAGAGRAGRARLPHGRAHLLPPVDRREAVAAHEALPALARTLAARHREMPEGSYTAELFRAGPERIGAKVEEEAEEVARAGREESDERVREEAADLLYHLGVVLEARGLTYADAFDELVARMDWRVRWPSRRPASPSRPSLDEAHALARDHNVIPLRHTFIDDIETPGVGVPEAARARPGVPARVRRAGTALRPLLVPRLPPARAAALRGRPHARDRAGRDARRWTRRRPVRRRRATTSRTTGSRRSRACRRSRAGRSACSATTSCARSSGCRSRTPTTSALPTWR